MSREPGEFVLATAAEDTERMKSVGAASAATGERLCACNCGRSLEGMRADAWWWSDACRKRAARRAADTEEGASPARGSVFAPNGASEPHSPDVARTRSGRRRAARQPDRERQVLAALVRRAGAVFGVDCGAYVDAVEHRLEIGAERFGDDAFLDRDNMAELLEKTPGVAGYALLELQRLDGRMSVEARDDLLRVVLLAAVADFYARRARVWLRDGGAT